MRPSLHALGLFCLIRISLAKLECTQEEAYTDKFIDGKWDENWEAVSGDGAITPMPQGGLYFQFTDVQAGKETASLGIQTKKTYTYPLSVTVQIQASNHLGVLSDMIFWPKAGQGEIDLELVAKNKDQIMCPIWAPVPEGEENPQPINANQAPPDSLWPTTENGPSIKLNPPKATAAKGEGLKNRVVMQDFDHSSKVHEYKLTYTESTVEGTVDGQPYITWTKGDAAQWPGDGAMHINLALWRDNRVIDGQPPWMGEYTFDAANLATMSVKQITIDGCAVNDGSDGDKPSDESEKDAPKDNPSDQAQQPSASGDPNNQNEQQTSSSTPSSTPSPDPIPQTVLLTSSELVSSVVTITSSKKEVEAWSGYGDINMGDLEQATTEVSSSQTEIETSVESSAEPSTSIGDDAPYESGQRIFGEDSSARGLPQTSLVILLFACLLV